MIKTNLCNSIENPLVSIVVVTYNSAKYVLETLESVKEQTYQNIELIISDDCSKDETVNICKKWVDDNDQRFVRTEIITTPINTGTACNLNRGIKISSGDWVKFIAGDDALYPHLINTYINYIKENNDVKFLHSNVQHYLETFEEKNRLPLQKAQTYKINHINLTPEDQFKVLLRTSLIGTPTVMIKKEVFEQLGLFDERFPLWEDRPIYLKITRGNIKLVYLNIVGAKYRERYNSVVRTKGKRKLISNFQRTKIRGFESLILEHLSGTEKTLKSVLIKIEKFFYNYLNKNVFPINIFFKLLVYPFRHLINKIDKKYR